MLCVRIARAGTHVEQGFLSIFWPGKKAEKSIFVGKHIVRHLFSPHLQRCPVTRAISEFSVAVNPCEILTHFPSLFPYNEKNALFCKMAMGHYGVPFAIRGGRVCQGDDSISCDTVPERACQIYGGKSVKRGGERSVFCSDLEPFYSPKVFPCRIKVGMARYFSWAGFLGTLAIISKTGGFFVFCPALFAGVKKEVATHRLSAERKPFLNP